ncbi:MAG: TRAP transporter substrate-binding protein [Proteobacteria bacterium]|nr:TRAP transporter substrate-binding protein [Pseudomonadota bacterium]
MRRMNSLGRATLALVLLLPSSVALGAAEATIKLAITPAGDHLYVHMANLMAKEIEKRVPGKVDWQLFPGAQLGRDDVVLTGLKTGTHVAGMPGSWVASVEPGLNLFEAPFLFANRDEVRKVIAAVEKDIARSLADKGIVLVGGIGELGFRQISNNVRPIVKPADLNGVKLRTPGTPFRVTTFKMFGANPTPMNFAEVYVAIRQGVIDGQENPLASIWAGKFHEVQKYISMSNHVFTPTTILFSKKHWDTWPADVRNAIDEAGRLANDFSFRFGAEKDQSLQADMKAQNPNLKFNDIDTPAFRKLAEPLYKELEAQVGKELWAKAMAALK